MRLRQIDIHGFKTFANSTQLDLPHGITAVVGPNGSGKSNISDAILWALGEQNVRNLRGGKLHDVIFAGSSTRRPTGYAEVSLTFDNASRKLALDYAEVTVCRRVYRSGESECFINRNACRLKDIVELFLDSGIGKESYFSLNQGEIDMVLSADPEERRVLFEQAAGIQRYRVRKRESLRKLDITEDNLVRIHDLMAEVESRVGPLERQSQRAERYLEVSEKKRQVELGVFAADWSALERRLASLRLQHEETRGRATASAAAMSRLAVEEETARLELQAGDNALEATHRELEEATTRRIELEGRLRVLDERMAGYAAAATRNREHSQDLDCRRAELADAIHGLEIAWAEAVDSHRKAEGEVTVQARIVSDTEQQARRAEAALEDHQRRAIEIAGRHERRLADLESAAARIATLEERSSRLVERARSLEAARLAAGERMADLACAGASDHARAAELSSEIEELSRSIPAIEAEKDRLERAVSEREKELSAIQSRKRLLEELHEQRNGYYRGVREVLKAAGGGRLTGHYRNVADILSVASAHEAALEAALGSHLQDIVTETDREARSGIELLKRERAGRATFLSLQMIRDLQRGGPALIAAGSGVVGAASELVEYEPRYGPVVEMLLGRIVVCDTLENATLLTRQLRGWSRIVTLEGEVISNQGAMTGGSPLTARTPLVGRSREIAELRSEIDRWNDEIGQTTARIAALSAPLVQMRSQRASVEAKKAALVTELARASLDREHLAVEVQRLDREIGTVEREFQETSAAIQSNRSRLAELSEKPDERPVTADDESAKKAATAARVARDHARDEASRARAEEAAARERAKSSRAALYDARSRLSTMDREQRTLAARMEEDERAAATAREDHARLASEHESLAERCAAASAAVETVRQDRDGVLRRLELLSHSIRDRMREEQEAAAAAGALQASINSLEGERLQIRTVLAEEYDVGASPEIGAAPAEEVLPTETQVRAFLETIGPSEDPDRDRRTTNRLRREIRALEPVNLDAVQEFREVTERLQFLREQRGDVESAAADLRAVIRKIDVEARRQFLESFHAIGREFDEMFRRLFGGGQTRLTLTDPSDPLTSGIEIGAQPPGKRLQSLQLLSGGERSLTAVALLFSMLKVKPVPFCVLDEVDAALDEANVARFADLLREFARETQFIIITHNRATMERADRLFGVTMTEPGVSRILTARLTEAAA